MNNSSLFKSLFNDSKYTKWYLQIINNARGRSIDFKFENHHIIPKSLGGDNSKLNLIKLTLREHFIVHLLLSKMCLNKKDSIKMNHAVWNMCNRDNGKRTSSRIYEILRKQRIKMMSELMRGPNNPMFGKVTTQEHKDKISKSSKGHKKSEETRKKMSIATSGSKNPMYGKKQSKSKIKQQSEMMKNNNPMWNKNVVEKIKEAKKGTYNCFDNELQKFVRITTIEYWNNKDRYKSNRSYEAKQFKEALVNANKN